MWLWSLWWWWHKFGEIQGFLRWCLEEETTTTKKFIHHEKRGFLQIGWSIIHGGQPAGICWKPGEAWFPRLASDADDRCVWQSPVRIKKTQKQRKTKGNEWHRKLSACRHTSQIYLWCCVATFCCTTLVWLTVIVRFCKTSNVKLSSGCVGTIVSQALKENLWTSSSSSSSSSTCNANLVLYLLILFCWH